MDWATTISIPMAARSANSDALERGMRNCQSQTTLQRREQCHPRSKEIRTRPTRVMTKGRRKANSSRTSRSSRCIKAANGSRDRAYWRYEAAPAGDLHAARGGSNECRYQEIGSMKARAAIGLVALCLSGAVLAAGSGSGSPGAGPSVDTSAAGRSGANQGPAASMQPPTPGGGTGGAGDGMRSPGQGSAGGMQPMLRNGSSSTTNHPGAPSTTNGGAQGQ